MKILLYFIVLILSVYCHSDEEFVDWESFKETFGKIYEDVDEDLKRLSNFIETRKKIENHNKEYKDGKHTYEQGLNHLADWSEEELKQLNGYKKRPTGVRYGGPNALTFIDEGNIELPRNFDWRNYGAVTPVKDQGSCGACWAFSTTGGLEGQMFRKTGQLVSLSEQNLLDCMQSGYCQGNWMDAAFEFIKDYGGIDSEEYYPYLGAQGQGSSCRYNSYYNSGSVSQYVDIPYNETLLAVALVEKGPISAAFDASHESIQRYQGGIYYEPDCDPNRPNHAILIVGYGTDENGRDYWIVKNSWNSWWGEQGYFRIARNMDSHCGIASWASFPVV